jgi:hypothetical protein
MKCFLRLWGKVWTEANLTHAASDASASLCTA